MFLILTVYHVPPVVLGGAGNARGMSTPCGDVGMGFAVVQVLGCGCIVSLIDRDQMPVMLANEPFADDRCGKVAMAVVIDLAMLPRITCVVCYGPLSVFSVAIADEVIGICKLVTNVGIQSMHLAKLPLLLLSIQAGVTVYVARAVVHIIFVGLMWPVVVFTPALHNNLVLGLLGHCKLLRTEYNSAGVTIVVVFAAVLIASLMITCFVIAMSITFMCTVVSASGRRCECLHDVDLSQANSADIGSVITELQLPMINHFAEYAVSFVFGKAPVSLPVQFVAFNGGFVAVMVAFAVVMLQFYEHK